MIRVRHSESRGVTESELYSSQHTFSFADYRDEDFMSYRCLGVLNEDTLQPGGELEPHSHKEVEILSVVLDGELLFKDSMGEITTVSQGQAHLLTAGTGVLHQECNPAKRKSVQYLQVWIVPDTQQLSPSGALLSFDLEAQQTGIQILVESDGTSGQVEESLKAHQEITVSYGTIQSGEELTLHFERDRHLWVHNLGLDLCVNDQCLNAGDGIAVEEEEELIFSSEKGANFILFNMQ